MFKLASTIIIISFVVITIVSIIYGVAIVQVLQNPELVGQFFGKIVQGFNSVK
jgi:uncharacterized protein YqhQ